MNLSEVKNIHDAAPHMFRLLKELLPMVKFNEDLPRQWIPVEEAKALIAKIESQPTIFLQ